VEELAPDVAQPQCFDSVELTLSSQRVGMSAASLRVNRRRAPFDIAKVRRTCIGSAGRTREFFDAATRYP
jgi:hypothetical protein